MSSKTTDNGYNTYLNDDIKIAFLVAWQRVFIS